MHILRTFEGSLGAFRGYSCIRLHRIGAGFRRPLDSSVRGNVAVRSLVVCLVGCRRLLETHRRCVVDDKRASRECKNGLIPAQVGCILGCFGVHSMHKRRTFEDKSAFPRMQKSGQSWARWLLCRMLWGAVCAPMNAQTAHV